MGSIHNLGAAVTDSSVDEESSDQLRQPLLSSDPPDEEIPTLQTPPSNINDYPSVERQESSDHPPIPRGNHHQYQQQWQLFWTTLNWSTTLPFCSKLHHATLFPDDELKVCGRRIMDGSFSIKLIKFLVMTFASIALVHGGVVDYVSF
jgi:hypothetical protein